jgi:hypothetical protein
MATVQIKHRHTDAVLFTHETTEERQASGLAMRDALEAATKARANLAGANLAGANLDGAYLARANLDGAKWREDITINRAPLQIAGLHWMVYILDQHMQIGCQLHTIAEWRDFDDAAIVDMDGKSALRFWRAHKSALLALAESDGRGVALSEIAESA